MRRHWEGPGQPPLARALTEQAIGGCSDALQTRDFSPLTRSPTLRRDLRFAALAVAALALLLGVLYPVSTLEFLRFLDPFGDHPAYSFTQIEIVEPSGTLQVEDNGSVVIKSRTSGHRPDDLYLCYTEAARPGVRQR